jgi:hypothetical protein
VIRRLIAIVLLATAACVLAAGCSKRHRIQVQSNARWLISIYPSDDREFRLEIQDSVSVNETVSYRVAGEVKCVAVEVQSQGNTNANGDSYFARVRIDDGPWALADVNVTRRVETCR